MNIKSRSLGLCLLVVSLVISGCGYGEVSPKTYELAKSLYSISNRKLSDKLDVAKEQIQLAHAGQEISDQEASWLHDIVERAENERWDQAMKSARRIMEDQVDAGS